MRVSESVRVGRKDMGVCEFGQCLYLNQSNYLPQRHEKRIKIIDEFQEAFHLELTAREKGKKITKNE